MSTKSLMGEINVEITERTEEWLMDKQFFAEEVRSQERSLYRVARSYLHSDADAADAVQEALTRAWEKRKALRDPALFRTWLTRILINTCKDMLRQMKRVQPVAEVPELRIAEPSREQDIRDALQALDARQRIILTLFHLDGYSLREIGQILSIPQGTVKNRLFRGRQKLRDALKEEVFGDEA